MIRVHTIFDVKVDGRHKAQVAADGHLTTTPTESVYSGVVSLQGLRTCLFIGELDGVLDGELDGVLDGELDGVLHGELDDRKQTGHSQVKQEN